MKKNKLNQRIAELYAQKINEMKADKKTTKIKEIAKQITTSERNMREILAGNRADYHLTIGNLEKIVVKGLDKQLIIEIIENNEPNYQELKERLAQKEQQIFKLEMLLRKHKKFSNDSEQIDYLFNQGQYFEIIYISHLSTLSQKEIGFSEAVRFYSKILEVLTFSQTALTHLGRLFLRKARRAIINDNLEFGENGYRHSFFHGINFYKQIENLYPEYLSSIAYNKIDLLLTEYHFSKQLDFNSNEKLLEAKKIIMNYWDNHKISLQYFLACVEANLGNEDEALFLLEEIYKKDSVFYQPRDREMVEGDEDLFILHHNQKFWDLINSWKEKY